MVHRPGKVPIWIKIFLSLFLCVLVPVYWRHYGPSNFLWGSDIALFLIFASAWSERPLFNSMAAIGVLPFELIWAADFFSGARLLDVTGYMFDDSVPLYLRGLSLYHLALPPLIVFLLLRLGYDRRALAAQTLLAWIILPLCYLTTDPADNINFVFGPGKEPQTLLPPLLYLGLGMVLVPLAIYLPLHLLLHRLLGKG